MVRPEFEAYVSLVGLIDAAAEAKRLEKQLGEKAEATRRREGEAGQPRLIAQGPARSGAGPARSLATDLENQIRAMEENLKDLKAG